MLKLKNICKYYGHKMVLHDINIEINKASIYGLIGPNGAGKTTLIRIICGILPFSKGLIDYNGLPFSRIAYMPDTNGLYTDMTVADEIKYIGQLRGLSAQEAMKRATPLIERLGLIQYKKVKVRTLSKGTMRKIQFVCTFLIEPFLAVLDEPFSGLDPISAIEMEKIIIEKKQQGVPILLSTHQMDQAERFCNHIFLINEGNLLVDEDLNNLKYKYMCQEFIVESFYKIPFPEINIKKTIYNDNHIWRWIIILDGSFTYKDMIQCIGNSKLLLLQRIAPSLKDIFIKAVKQS